tara:strand:- start:245 stop:811 length:567 start_codon:yes stop_codon:yes gene_type:complete
LTPWITKPIPFNIGQGAAAAGGGAVLTLQYESTSYPVTTHGMRELYGTGRFAGSHVGSGSVIGLNIQQVIMWAKQTGDCSGLDLVAQVRNNLQGCTVYKELGVFDAGAIDTNFEAITFPAQASGYTLVENDVIGMYLDGGDSSNKITNAGAIGGAGDSNTNYGESNSCTWDKPGAGNDVQQPTIQIWG